VVERGSAEALASAALGAFADPDAWQRASDGARRVAIDQDPERVGRRLREVYELVAGGVESRR
jgi:ABC-type sugar transport system substrate-binding protein